MKNFILGMLVVIIIGAVGIGGYLLGKGKGEVNTPQPSPTAQIVALTPTPEVINTAAPTQEDIKEAIKKALIKKNNWSSNMDLEITISKNDGTYVSGGAKEKNAEAGGGYFFAVKKNGEWIIVADGNGVITCASLASYPDYPSSYISECWDESTGKTVNR